MDPLVELYRQEKAKRGRASPASPPEEWPGREKFLQRLAQLRGEQTLRAFADAVELPHSTIDSWDKNPRAQPHLPHLRAIAEHAELDGVPKGRLSVDWLCGLSDEPSRDARAEVGQLPLALAKHVAQEVSRRVPRTGFWKSFVSYWRIDGAAIIAQAIERELECFRRASDGLHELARAERAVIEEQVADNSATLWPERSQSREQRKARVREEQRRRRGLVGHLVHALTHAEFVRRVNEFGAAMIYDPGLLERRRGRCA